MNEEILKRLDLLASKLNVTADHLWQAYLRQSRIEGFTDAFLLVLALVVIVIDIKWGMWLYKKEEDMWLLAACIGFIAGIVALVCIISIPTELFNPEYFAFHRIMEGVK